MGVGRSAGAERRVANLATLLSANEPNRFTSETAERSGRSERAVQLDARRGERIAPAVLEEVRADPAMNRGTVLDALARTPKADQPDAAS